MNFSFYFTVASNAYELNNLDNEALDAPMYSGTMATDEIAQNLNMSASSQDFTSLPCETFLVACRTEKDINTEIDSFNYKNPMYQSAHVQLTSADNPSEETKKGGRYTLIFFLNTQMSSNPKQNLKLYNFSV